MIGLRRSVVPWAYSCDDAFLEFGELDIFGLLFGDKIIHIVRIKIFYSSYCLCLFLEDFNKGNKISIGINIVNNY